MTELIPHQIPSHLPKMADLYEDLFSGGKGFRASLVLQVAQEIGLSEKDGILLARCIEFIHNSSLLHDDLVDQSVLRRGKVAAWKKYSSGYAVLAGDYLLARVMKELAERGSLELIHYTSQTILDLVEGEWLQDATLKRTDVTQEEIELIHIKKTSSLFSWCFKAPTFLKDEFSSENVDHLFKIGELFGLLLQRSDDLLDFDIRNYEGKTFFTDLKSGYFNSFMVEVLQDFSEEQKKQVFETATLEEFLETFKIDLNKSLEAYDEKSKQLLQELKQMISQFKSFRADFKNELIEGADKIYWRKS